MIEIDLHQNADGSLDGRYKLGDKPVLNSGGTPALAWSAPQGLVDGNSLTITTDGTYNFGSGPANVRFEDFSAFSDNEVVTAVGSIFDVASSFWNTRARADVSRSKGIAGDFVVPKNSNATIGSTINQLIFEAPVTEVFVSYATQVPTGAYMPGAAGGNSGTNADYSNDSAWKTAWLLGPDSGTCDLVIPTLVGDSWSLAGNDLGILMDNIGGDAPSWWKFGAWNRLTTYLKAGPQPEVDAGEVYFQAANAQQVISEFTATPVIFGNSDGDTQPLFTGYHWTQLNINGWMRDGGGSDGAGTGVDFRYDDIYVAYGANAAARVELGNAATYPACTDLAICKPTSWANGQIDLSIQSGAFSLSESLWLHITLADNTTRYTVQVN